MKCLLLPLISQALLGQSVTASIQGTVTDAQTQKPVPAALVMAVHTGLPALSQRTKSGADGAFQPDLTLGVWGPKGLFYPVHSGSKQMNGAVDYQLQVPRDTALKFQISSRDLKLADPNGVALPANASQQTFQHATGDATPKSFTFTVLGLLP